MVDALLINMRTPRYRSLSDGIAENGINIIKNHLKKEGLEVIIEDKNGPSYYESFSPRWITNPLNILTKNLIENISQGKKPSYIVAIPSLLLQKSLDLIQNYNMNNYLDNIIEKININNIPIVGQKVWYGDSFYWANELNKKIINNNPEIITIDGGPHPSVYREDYAKISNADIIIYSEGEYSLAEIIKMIKFEKLSKDELFKEIEKRKIPNTIITKSNQFYIGDLKIKDINEKTIQIQEKDYLENGLRFAVINDALGCPYNACSFCNYKKIYPKYYSKKVSNIIDEIESLVKSGIGLFRFSSGSNELEDSILIAEKIINKGLKINYSFFNRVEKEAQKNYESIVDKYKLLMKSGLRAVFLGAESGNEKILKEIMNKGIKYEDIVYTIKAIRDAEKQTNIKFDIALSIIYPHPIIDGVTLEECYKDTLKLIEETRPDSVLVNPPAPFKDSPWLKEEKYGYGYINKENLNHEKKIQSIIQSMIKVDYKPYLPPSMWDHPPITLQGLNAKEIFELNSKMRTSVTKLDIVNDLGDDSFIMLRAANYNGVEGAKDFRKDATIAILSCHYDKVKEIYKKINKTSLDLARSYNG
jgi:radical SAM superfamily enzyme YgiQ (UPF0313 family)